jgi:hypothetical protein
VQSLWQRTQVLKFALGTWIPGIILFKSTLLLVFIKTVYVKSIENNADVFTKNASQDIYKKHEEMFLGKFEEMNG